jgi:hypothetical protein
LIVGLLLPAFLQMRAGDSAADEASLSSSSSVPSTLVGFSSSYLARRMGAGSSVSDKMHAQQYSSRRLAR